MSTEPTRM